MSKFFSLAVLGALFLFLAVTPTVAQEVVFSPGPTPTPSSGASNGGFAWLDINGDGLQDVFIPPNNVLLNHLTYFTQISSTATAALTGNVNSVGALFADFNGDGLPDIFSTNNGAPATGLFYDSAGVYVYANPAGDLPKAGVDGEVFQGAAAGPIDHTNYLSLAWPGSFSNIASSTAPWSVGGIWLLKGGPTGYTNIGNGATAGNLAIDTAKSYESWDVHFLDANNDGYQDLFMPSFRNGYSIIDTGTSAARKGCVLFLNDGTGKFVVPTSPSYYRIDSIVKSANGSRDSVTYASANPDTGIVVDDTVRHFAAIGSQWGDLNNDGNVDLILTGLAAGDNRTYNGTRQQIVVLYGKGDGTFTDKWNGVSYVASGLPVSGSIRAWDIGDYNNDGIPDVYASTTFGTTRLFRGNGNGTYTEVTNQDYVATAGGGRAGGFVDFNNDGFLDIYNYTGLNSVLQKNSGNSNNWIAFTPVGTGNNLNAVGARFTVYAQNGTLVQTRWIRAEAGSAGHGEMRALFGLGINTSIDSVVVSWPDGNHASYTGLAVNKYWTIKEGSTVPNMPTLESPANGTTDVATADTLKWDAATGAAGYTVQVSMDPTFANKKLMAVNATVAGTSYAFTLGPATKYYWRVAAMNGGFASDFTAADNFTTAGAAAATVPTIIVPSSISNVLKNTINNYNAAPVLMFVLPAGKTLAYYGSFTFRGYFAQGDVGYKNIIAEAFQTMPTGHAYDNTANQIGSYNRAQMGSTGWENITINIKNTTTLHDTIYIDFGINCAATGNIGGTGVPTIWYADNVTLWDTTGGMGPSQNFEGYSVGAQIPHIGWAASDIQAVVAKDPLSGGVSGWPSNLTMIVNKTSDASRYQWQVSTLPSFPTFVVNDSTADTTDLAQFAGGQTFYLRVRGTNDLGASAFSATQAFTIMTPPARTTLVSPANAAQNVITDSVVFVWRMVAGAASYNMQLSTVNSTSTFTGITDTTYKVKGLTRLTNYSWKVEAINGGGTSYFTAANTFTTVVAAPAVPTASLPASAATGVNRLTRFSWGPVLNATKYELQVATDNAFTTIVRDTVSYDTTATLQSPLDANSDYYWRVNAQDLGGASAFSTARLFSTGTLLAVQPQPDVPKVFVLQQNYPNPFNPTTRISYDIPKTARVQLRIYDVLGQVVATLVDGIQGPNRYIIDWNANNLSTGVYFLRIQAHSQDGSGEYTSVKKLMLMK